MQLLYARRGCYDPDVDGMTCRTEFRWLRSFGLLGKVEMGEMNGDTEVSAVVEYFNWWAPIGKFSGVETGPCVHDDL